MPLRRRSYSVTFEEYARQHVSESSAATYARIERVWTAAGARTTEIDSLVAWFNEFATIETPLGTAQSYRAAVTLAARWQGVDIAGRLVRRKWRQQALRSSLSATDLAAYLAAVRTLPEPSASILALLPYTALRIGEACALRRDDIIPHGALLVARVLGKGSKPRVVPVVGHARAVVAARTAEAPRGSPWLFPSPQRRDRHAQPDTVRAHLRTLRAGNPELFDRVTPHVLRHTAASNMLAAKVDLRTLQEVLGHQSITTTEKYLHPDVDALARALETLDSQ